MDYPIKTCVVGLGYIGLPTIPRKELMQRVANDTTGLTH
jgi:UDP-N-acetyl-D-mannosaminuronate dehydrogenase